MTGMNGAASLITVATCNLNQWALDFDGNLERIYQSCQIAKERGATYRLGPELEICGYGCEDHFLEPDTFSHCWESLATLLQRGATDNLLCDFGMPLLHGGVRYNCRLVCYNRRILMVRPKRSMADNGNYRESRYFTAYRGSPSTTTTSSTDNIILPLEFFKLFGQRTAPFGTHYLQFGDGVSVGCESCEELWTPQATHIDLALRGVEIIGNGSGSHHELRKLQQRLELMIAATRKCGGVYLYSNQRGCDGGRLYYDGCAMIVCNGNVLAQAKQFDLEDVEVVTATIDLEDVRSYRASIPSFGIQATEEQHVHHGSTQAIHCSDMYLLRDSHSAKLLPTTTKPQTELRLHTPEEECCLGPACWLWDYLRRSGASGYFLPLSGGADSSSVATIVGTMCQFATSYAQANPTGQVAHDCRRLCGKVPAPATIDTAVDNDGNNAKDNLEPWVPRNSQELAKFIFHTTFMGTDNSSENTTSRARRLGESIGSYHLSIKIDLMVEAVVKVFALATGRTPRFALHGGTWAEDVALQNIQARLRMVTAYLLAQLLPWVRGQGSGFLLVLGSANVDEGLRGYLTKYDCSSADLNPIGAISKTDLKKMLLWASDKYQWPVLTEIAGAPPTAELRPIVSQSDSHHDAEHSQLDEEEMGMTYAELSLFGTLRKISRCGPVTMFRKLCETWSHLQPSVVAEKVKRFFYFYAINRHKMCTITPAYHAEAYSPDDNRFDLRQFLYNVRWPRQFSVIDSLVEKDEQATEREDDQVVVP